MAIAVKDLPQSLNFYQTVLNVKDVTQPTAQPEHGVLTSFVKLENTQVYPIAFCYSWNMMCLMGRELLHPIEKGAPPISAFLEKKPEGGIHVILWCFLCLNFSICVLMLMTWKGP